MLRQLLTTLYNCLLFLRQFILWNLRSVGNPRAFVFEYLLNVHRPSDDTVENIHSIFDLFRLYSTQSNLKRDTKGSADDNTDSGTTKISARVFNQKVVSILSRCPDDENVLQVVDEDGYNLLQKAIIANNLHLIHGLVKKGCDVNVCQCSPPLHLACKLGNASVVKLLLKHKARIDLEAGMCYPKPHACMNQAHSKFFFIDKNVYDCERNKKRPVLYAIDHDNVDLVQMLSEFDTNVLTNQKHLLHYACSQGSFECVEYLYSQRPEDINRLDDAGYTPLLHAVQWGYVFSKTVLTKGASISCCTPNRETPLHILFLKSKAPDSWFETAKLLLGSGLEDAINAQDNHGNTALHNLVGVVKHHMSNEDYKLEEWDRVHRGQTLLCVDLLLRYNSDPTLCNKEGLTPIHVLLTLFYEKFHVTTEADGHYLRLAFDLLHDILKVFLDNNMDPNIASPGGRTPLMILLPQVLHIDYSTERCCCQTKISCLKLLCHHGADPNFVMATENSCVSLMSQFATQVIRIRYNTSPEVLRQIKQANADHLTNILVLLLRNGLNPNFTSNRRRPQMEPGSGNGLVEFVKLAQNVTEPKDFALIHNWILTILQWGGNPDIEPFPSESIICQSQSSIFLKHNCTQAVNHFMLEIQDFSSWLDGDHAEQLLMLFVNSMDHLALYQCLGSSKFMSRFNPNHKPSRKFSQMIHQLNSNPRCLKQISRVAILKAMDRKIIGKVDKLPLPRLLRDYISDLSS